MTDETSEPEPQDAELVAYLDGELEPAEARELEDRLDADPKLRARAEGLKRSYDLLDFLPKPEPSPTFATRTMDKLPASGAKPAVSSSSATTMTPAPLSSLSVTGMPRPQGVPWAWAAWVMLAASLAIGVGYLGTAALRTYVFPPSEPKEPGTDSLSVSELRAIANLPLYAVVDDYEFLTQLAAPEFFGEEISPPDWLLPAHPLEAEKPSDRELQSLLRTFRELPHERQEKIRALDQQIHALDPPKRDKMLRLLETYAAWLQRLPEADRKEILGAANSSKRFDALREVHLKQWLAALPASHRNILKELPTEERVKQQLKWRAEEEKSRTEWAVARVQWESLHTGKQPWPFADDKMKEDVRNYIRAVYKPDDPNPKRHRLSAFPDGGDAARLKDALDRAEKGEWALLGKAVHDFSRKYEMLPEPAKGNPVTEIADLPAGIGKLLEKRPKLSKPLEQAAGKWPEFSLTVHGDLGAKATASLPGNRLGPCLPEDFKDDFRRGFGELRTKLTDGEKTALKLLEGQWPNYPREVVRLARVHDVSLPGVLPPGPPSMWEKTYNPPRQPMRPPG